MNRCFALIVAILPCLFGCTSTVAYRPASTPDKLEFDRDVVDIYPGDIREDPNLYTNVGVGWAGIIKTSKITVEPDGTIDADLTLEHRYYDWQEQATICESQISVSPRGEGLFRTQAVFRRVDPDAGPAEVESLTNPGNLAIVYGVPASIDDGTVVLNYRYLRVVEPDDYSISQFDYGRFGEPVRYVGDSTASP